MADLSVIIPVFNEKDNIEPLYSRLRPVLEELGRPYEIIFVDDGSGDGGFDAIKALSKRDAAVRALRLCRHFGQTAALAAGFDYAKGGIFITMDGDLQNDPKDIPLLLKKMQEGYDIVSGWREKRKAPLFTKKIPSWLANRLISAITGVSLHDYGCTLKVYKRGALKNINLYGEMHRFLPALASWNGVSIAEVPVRHHARLHGRTNYGLSRTSRVILDLITVKFLLTFSTKPIQLFGGGGFLSLFIAGISAVAVILMKIFQGKDMTGNPLLYLTILLLVVGIQFVMMGLLGEIMARIYHESRKHPTYLVKETI